MNGSWAGFTVNLKWTDGDIKGGSVWRSTWWPAAGFRNANGAAMTYVANTADYWSSSFYSSPTDNRSYHLGFGYNGTVYPSNSYYRSHGFPLRCVQE